MNMQSTTQNVLGGASGLDVVSCDASGKPLAGRLTSVYCLTAPNRRLRQSWKRFCSYTHDQLAALMDEFTSMPLATYRDLRSVVDYEDWILRCAHDDELLRLLCFIKSSRYVRPFGKRYSNDQLNRFLGFYPDATIGLFQSHISDLHQPCKACKPIPTQRLASLWEFFDRIKLSAIDLDEYSHWTPSLIQILCYPDYCSRYPDLVKLRLLS